ncbi:MAG: hypothetical protein RIQ60_70 [Pseudomonadota bacterium]
MLTRPPFQRLRPLVLLSGAVALGACSTVSETLSPGKVDYKAATLRAEPLDIPPDLTQLTRDPRYQPSSGQPVSAAAIQAAQPVKAGAAPTTPATLTAPTATGGTFTAGTPGGVVAPLASGAVRIERAGNQRWLVVQRTPEELWPQLRGFWPAAGFKLALDQPELGFMETDWAENRSKLPQDAVRRTLGKLFDSLLDSGQRDRFRLRVERSTSSNATEVYLSHRGAVQVKSGLDNDRLHWELTGADTQVEAEMLARLMLYLAPPAATAGVPQPPTAAPDVAALAAAKDTVVNQPGAPARARLLSGRPAATLQVDDDFSRAWRRVGVALDRSGFTVEDRDRGQGLYYVRYVDPKFAGKEEPGFFARVFGGAKTEDYVGTRYRVGVQAEGKGSVVAVFDAQGAPQNNAAALNIVKILLDDLR